MIWLVFVIVLLLVGIFYTLYQKYGQKVANLHRLCVRLVLSLSLTLVALASGYGLTQQSVFLLLTWLAGALLTAVLGFILSVIIVRRINYRSYERYPN